MASLRSRIRRLLRGSVQESVNPRFDQVERQVHGLDEKLDRITHLVDNLDAGVQANRGQILAARHEAHVLMVTDIDAANEATALLGRSQADLRDLVEERFDRIEARLDGLDRALAELGATDLAAAEPASGLPGSALPDPPSAASPPG